MAVYYFRVKMEGRKHGGIETIADFVLPVEGDTLRKASARAGLIVSKAYPYPEGGSNTITAVREGE